MTSGKQFTEFRLDPQLWTREGQFITALDHWWGLGSDLPQPEPMRQYLTASMESETVRDGVVLMSLVGWDKALTSLESIGAWQPHEDGQRVILPEGVEPADPAMWIGEPIDVLGALTGTSGREPSVGAYLAVRTLDSLAQYPMASGIRANILAALGLLQWHTGDGVAAEQNTALALASNRLNTLALETQKLLGSPPLWIRSRRWKENNV